MQRRPLTAIVGAGPSGLSIAAHLNHHGASFRIFGNPMSRWRHHMPAGMFLKSEVAASSLSEPTGRHTLQRFYRDGKILEKGGPIPIQTFVNYAESFRQHLVPAVEQVMVERIDRRAGGFRLRLDTGEELEAEKLVMATGLSHAAYMPRELEQLPHEAVSHSGDHKDFAKFKSKTVVVIGAGQSALESAALLHESGANVTLVARRSVLQWNDFPGKRSDNLWNNIRRPHSALGDGVDTWFYANAPSLFYRLPERFRVNAVRSALGPAGAWWLRERVIDRFTILAGNTVMDAQMQLGSVLVRFVGPGRRVHSLAADHVIAATGYRFSLQSLPFIADELAAEVRIANGSPVLSPAFMSTVPGLYFTGLASAYSFGPAMRFIHGADFTARRISRDLLAARKASEARPALVDTHAPTSERVVN